MEFPGDQENKYQVEFPAVLVLGFRSSKGGNTI